MRRMWKWNRMKKKHGILPGLTLMLEDAEDSCKNLHLVGAKSNEPTRDKERPVDVEESEDGKGISCGGIT
jgi:hypothetical protein